MKCSNCKKTINKIKSQSKRSKSGNLFCSRSCSAIFNNKANPKRKNSNFCVKCNTSIRSDGKYCSTCYKNHHYLEDKTLKEATLHRNDANRYCNIRKGARKKYMKSDAIKSCAVCDYSKHIEICHIKDISKFSLDSTIGEVNSLDNLVALCRNHHWEMDHNCLSKENEQKIKNRPGRI